MNEVTVNKDDLMYKLIIDGDVSKLSGDQQVQYYMKYCESLGLNPHTKPFDYITLNGKRVLYAKKDATEQLRKINGVSITGMDSKCINDVWVTQVTASDKTGRTDMATGAVNITGLKGDALANAVMKAETKAKRRATLSICGLGVLDETELETIPASAKQPIIVPTASAPELPESTTPPEHQDQKSPEQAHAQASPDAHVMIEGEVIGGWFWKIPKEQRNSYIPEGCKFEKVDGKWTVIKTTAA